MDRLLHNSNIFPALNRHNSDQHHGPFIDVFIYCPFHFLSLFDFGSGIIIDAPIVPEGKIGRGNKIS